MSWEYSTRKSNNTSMDLFSICQLILKKMKIPKRKMIKEDQKT